MSHVDRNIASMNSQRDVLLLKCCYFPFSRLLNWDCSCSEVNRSADRAKTGSRAHRSCPNRHNTVLHANLRWVIVVNIHACSVPCPVRVKTLTNPAFGDARFYPDSGDMIRQLSSQAKNPTHIQTNGTISQLIRKLKMNTAGLTKVAFCMTSLS